MRDPRPELDYLGVRWEQVVDPDDGYDGTYTPECVYLHWTASGRYTDTAASVVAANHYHACAGRDGVVALGGWAVKQAHGGSGRCTPITIARTGAMMLGDLMAWQDAGEDDDTDSWPNRYGVAVSIDNDGVGEVPPDLQWHAFTSCAAALIDCIDGASAGHLIDHAASTNRKIDLATSPAVLPERWWADITTQLALLQKGPQAVSNMCVGPPAVHPAGGYAQVTELGYVYVNGPGARYHGGAQDEFVIREAGHRITGLAWTPSGNGYYMNCTDGNLICRGDAQFYGAAAPDMVPG